jgi:hypothetical protein
VPTRQHRRVSRFRQTHHALLPFVAAAAAAAARGGAHDEDGDDPQSRQRQEDVRVVLGGESVLAE